MRVLHLSFVAAFGAIALFMNGCSSHQQLYNYGEYSDSYYELKKTPGEESLLEYQKALEEAIENADKSRSKRVAPGMYANLGYLHLKANQRDKAIELFAKEKSLYPEAAFFMDRMINKIKAMEAKDAK